MSKYKLISFDMDGTLLNSQKELSTNTLDAIIRAKKAGKIVILSSGRGIAELADFQELLTHLDYLICTSGAMIYDLKAKKEIYSNPLVPDQIEKIFQIAALEGAMTHILTDRSIIQRNHLERMDEFHMSVYQPTYRQITEQWEDMQATYLAHPFLASKFNLYHTSPASRERSRKRILDAGLDVTLVNSEITSLEISAKGVNKGAGLQKLCQHLHLPLEATIAVGDADNDLEILQIAGLSIGMGNANENVRKIADVLVSDCDHDGCVEAIDRYLLV